MDKVTCIAFILYHSSDDNTIRDFAIKLLNGDVSLREATDNRLSSLIAMAEFQYKKKKPNSLDIQNFADEFMLVEV
ncbi:MULTISPECIES: hypothetical protein [unclassified Bacillus (in: firmicutes)]|uniref:hypothetical protein n=1 Tax=unclassified Bacillus (in: firmicutes) TaxID=185979 RepID=UPI0008F366AC|nr:MULTISPECIES: hypothetical protein [unclassified Bacillus (in: firmicutes)]SFA70547.1 hypothetical protein SAMN02799634_101125 [Bacillus sp. UNCCL13]SFQ60395.1 hypothetical protein SAMN04488577_0409 [Bacillus sp. cl95]